MGFCWLLRRLTKARAAIVKAPSHQKVPHRVASKQPPD